jgi:hypothetical protein
MKSFNNYIFEKLKISNSTKALASFEDIQMFTQEDQFDENGLSLDYFKGVDDRNKTICYIECFVERFGESFMMVIFNDDVYLDMFNRYKLEENEEIGWDYAPQELVELVQDKLDTQLDVYVCGAGVWFDTRYNQLDLSRFEKFIEQVYTELK